MGMRLRVCLTAEEDRTLRELRRATTVPQRVKDRAEVVRMNARGDYVETVAAYFDWHIETVRKAIHRWQQVSGTRKSGIFPILGNRLRRLLGGTLRDSPCFSRISVLVIEGAV